MTRLDPTPDPLADAPVSPAVALRDPTIGDVSWVQHPNNPHTRQLVAGSGPHAIVLGSIRSWFDRDIGHVFTVRSGEWEETGRMNRKEAESLICRRLGLTPPGAT